MLLALAGCYQWPQVDPDPLETTDPLIVTASVSCSEHDAAWSFALTTDAWTGAGKLALSTDGEYVEQHSLASTSAASDGSSDTLGRSLAIVATWRDAVPDSSTAFACSTPDLAGVLSVYSRDGSARTSCLGFGVEPGRWSSWDPDTACADAMTGETWPAPEDSGETGG